MVIYSITDTEALSNTKCYICVYSEKNGIIMPGGTEKCIDPFGDKQTRDIGVDECRGMCYVCQVILIRSGLVGKTVMQSMGMSG